MYGLFRKFSSSARALLFSFNEPEATAAATPIVPCAATDHDPAKGGGELPAAVVPPEPLRAPESFQFRQPVSPRRMRIPLGATASFEALMVQIAVADAQESYDADCMQSAESEGYLWIPAPTNVRR